MDRTHPALCAKIELMQQAARPRPLVVRGLNALLTRGVAYAWRRAAERTEPVERTLSHVPDPRQRRSWPPRADESLGLTPGELVEVKSPEEIRATLDDRGMYKGLYFMGEMWQHCGRRFTVLQPVRRIMVETTGELRDGIRNTLLLDDCCCDGSSNGDCEAHCFHLWREVWLRRVDAEAPGEPEGATR